MVSAKVVKISAVLLASSLGCLWSVSAMEVEEEDSRPVVNLYLQIEDMTELGTAAAKGDLTTVRQLIQQGAEVNGANKKGATALHAAARAGKPAVIQELLNAGAEINALDLEKHTAVYYAVEGGSCKAIEALVEGGADLNTSLPLVRAFELKKADIMNALIDAGAQVNVWVNAGPGYVPLVYYYASIGNTEMVKKLVEAGADINAHGRYHTKNLTPLDIASINGHAEVVSYLEEQGAKRRNTAMHLVRTWCWCWLFCCIDPYWSI